MKITSVQRDDWDHKILEVLWSYCTTYKMLTGQIPFRPVYGKELVMPMEYSVPSLRIDVVTEMTDVVVIKNIVATCTIIRR